MQKKSFHKTLLVVDKQRVKCERTFFLSYFLYKIEIAVTGMFRFAEKVGQDLAEGIQSDILNTLGMHRSQLFQDDVGGHFLSLFPSFGSSEVLGNGSFQVCLDIIGQIVFLHLLFILLGEEVRLAMLYLI